MDGQISWGHPPLQHPGSKEAGGGKGTERGTLPAPCSPWVELDMSLVPLTKQVKCFPVLSRVSSPSGTHAGAWPHCQPSWGAGALGSRVTRGQEKQKSAKPCLFRAPFRCCASACVMNVEKASPRRGKPSEMCCESQNPPAAASPPRLLARN